MSFAMMFYGAVHVHKRHYSELSPSQDNLTLAKELLTCIANYTTKVMPETLKTSRLKSVTFKRIFIHRNITVE
jgi:hypothetical protein